MMRKQSASMGSALPDPEKDQASGEPVPPPAIANKPPPGQKGPVGLQPRQTFSRVNTGTPPTPTVGTEAKSTSPRGLESLPQKIAEASMASFATKPSIQDMIKAAMAGTVSKVDITKEASRQLGNQGVEAPRQQKLASPDHIPTEYVTKLADAVGYIAHQIKQAETHVGEGPGALPVLQATSSGKNIDAGETAGSATPAPGLQAEKVQSGKANTGLETNDEMMHSEQPVDPWHNEHASNAPASGESGIMTPKTSSMKLAQSNFMRLAKMAEDEVSPGLAAIGAVPAHLLGGMVPGVNLVANPIAGPIGAYHGAKEGKTYGAAAKGSIGASTGANIGGLAGLLGGGGLGAGLGGLGGLAVGRPAEGAALGGLLGAVPGMVAGQVIGGKKGYRMAMGPRPEEEAAAAEAEKMSSAPVAYIRYFAKQAEDALNPAQISSGKAAPPEASASEMAVPAEPSDVTSQKRLVDSNQAAINYTKGQAKKDPISDVSEVLDEKPMDDNTLQKTLDHTGAAGVKMSSARKVAQDTIKVAAARALLTKLAKEVDSKSKKEKTSQGGMGAPPGVPQPQFTQQTPPAGGGGMGM